MASCSLFLGRLVFFLLLLIQGGFLVAYSLDYDEVAFWVPIVQGVLFAIRVACSHLYEAETSLVVLCLAFIRYYPIGKHLDHIWNYRRQT